MESELSRPAATLVHQTTLVLPLPLILWRRWSPLAEIHKILSKRKVNRTFSNMHFWWLHFCDSFFCSILTVQSCPVTAAVVSSIIIFIFASLTFLTVGVFIGYFIQKRKSTANLKSSPAKEKPYTQNTTAPHTHAPQNQPMVKRSSISGSEKPIQAAIAPRAPQNQPNLKSSSISGSEKPMPPTTAPHAPGSHDQSTFPAPEYAPIHATGMLVEEHVQGFGMKKCQAYAAASSQSTVNATATAAPGGGQSTASQPAEHTYSPLQVSSSNNYVSFHKWPQRVYNNYYCEVV